MSQLNATSAIGFNQRNEGSSRFNEMSSEDFIRVIFTELQNQDPLDPSDTSSLLEQLNSIRSIESDIQLTAKLEKLVTENQLASAGTMIGKFVGGLTDDAQRVAGYVVSVVRQSDEIYVELDNRYFVRVDNVETIINPTLIEEVPPTTNNTGSTGNTGNAGNTGNDGDSDPVGDDDSNNDPVGDDPTDPE